MKSTYMDLLNFVKELYVLKHDVRQFVYLFSKFDK